MNDTYCFVINDKNEVIAQGMLYDFVSIVHKSPHSHVMIRLEPVRGDKNGKLVIYPKESVFYRSL